MKKKLLFIALFAISNTVYSFDQPLSKRFYDPTKPGMQPGNVFYTNDSSPVMPDIDLPSPHFLPPIKQKHKCESCEKLFPSPSKLKRHRSVHTGEQNFQCTYPDCCSRFTQNSSLTYHIKNSHRINPLKRKEK